MSYAVHMSSVCHCQPTLRRGPQILLVLLTGCALCASGVACLQSKSESPSEPASMPSAAGVAGRPLKASFVREGCSLFWVTVPDLMDASSMKRLEALRVEQLGEALPAGLPLTLWERLLAVCGENRRPVMWPSDLRGMVRIDDGKQALAFVRLFSSPGTNSRFPDFRYMEVAEASTPGWPMPGEMPTEQFRQLGLRRAEVVAEGEGFRVWRSAAIMQKSHGTLIDLGRVVGFAILDETVTRDGDYVIRVLWETSTVPKGVTVGLPSLR